MSAGLSQILSLLSQITNSQANLEDTLDEIDSLKRTQQETTSEASKTAGQIRQNQATEDALTQKSNLLSGNLADYYDLLNETMENENPLDNMYCGIKEFVVDNSGMCGMGMGMGSLQLNQNIKLTGKELIAMSAVLNDNADGRLDAAGLVEELHQAGIENASAQNGEIVLTRVDENGNESQVKFKDANGDGMLNGCDYDFSDALAKFNQDLTEYNAKLDGIRSDIETTASELELTDNEREIVSNTIDNLKTIKKGQDSLLDEVDNQIRLDKKQAENLEARMKELRGEVDEATKAAEEEAAEAAEDDSGELSDHQQALIAAGIPEDVAKAGDAAVKEYIDNNGITLDIELDVEDIETTVDDELV